MTKGEETRQRIIRKAAPLFNQRGFEGSSMGEIMEATKLEKGGIYRHFSGKEELAAEAFDYAWAEALKTRTHDLDQVENSVDKLKQFVTNFVERRPERQPFTGSIVVSTLVDSMLGYVPAEFGPVYRFAEQVNISRFRTLLVKWGVMVILGLLTSGVYMAIAHKLGMPITLGWQLWLYGVFAISAVGITSAR